MGIILLPFILITIVIGIIATIKTITLLKKKSISFKEIALGVFISLSFFGLLLLAYLSEGEAWIFSPVFRISIFMVLIPFIIHLLTQKSEEKSIRYFSTGLLISITITNLICIVLTYFSIDLFDIINIRRIV